MQGDSRERTLGHRKAHGVNGVGCWCNAARVSGFTRDAGCNAAAAKVKTTNLETQRDGAATKTKSKTTNPETQRKRRKQRFFGGIAAKSAIISQATKRVGPTLQPQKTSAPSASSAFQGLWF